MIPPVCCERIFYVRVLYGKEKKNMSKVRKLFTSESVTEGHPDKICDQISDAVLDEILARDPMARVACETFATTGVVTVMGEITTAANINIESIARKVILDIGYTHGDMCFDGHSCGVMVSVHEQSPDISMGVTATDSHEQGAGDQGMMFGYACTETPELMPMPIALAHRLTRRMTEVRKNGTCPWMRPDGKSQVTVAYEDGKPVAVDAVVISTQHAESVSHEEIEKAMIEEVIKKVIPAELLHENTKYYVNPTGRFVIGGPAGDTGLTGRKIIVDTYGGYCAHGGGCFSGKDPSKVDRSAAYAARHASKNLVAAGLCERCQIEVAYAIGVAEPVSLTVDTYGTGKYADDVLSDLVSRVFDMRPAAIIERLDLRRPIYRATAAYGHFGREEESFTWERTDYVEKLQAEAAKL